jgi:hypothetical protein
MDQKKRSHPFNREIISEDNHPNIYIVSTSEKKQLPKKGEPAEKEPPKEEKQKKAKESSASFFGHHISRLFAPGKAPVEELPSIDKELESSFEVVRKKLQHSQAAFALAKDRIAQEEMKHRRFIEERNKAQEALFEDVLRSHGEFGTGLTSDDLFSLHDFMKMEADHEDVCSAEGSLHEVVECNLLGFLRTKAGELAWQKLEENMSRFHILFPISSSMEDRAEPLRTEQIRESEKKSARDHFLNMPAKRLAELILGNVPVWVYSYPEKETYLWQLTVLQGVAAGMAAHHLMRFLSVWEENTSEILTHIEHEFVDEIRKLRQRGESTTDLSQAYAVSMELQRLSKETIPDRIWHYISDKVQTRA